MNTFLIWSIHTQNLPPASWLIFNPERDPAILNYTLPRITQYKPKPQSFFWQPLHGWAFFPSCNKSKKPIFILLQARSGWVLTGGNWQKRRFPWRVSLATAEKPCFLEPRDSVLCCGPHIRRLQASHQLAHGWRGARPKLRSRIDLSVRGAARNQTSIGNVPCCKR